MIDSAFEWMAAHPWSVGILIAATFLFVGLFDTIPGMLP